MGDINFGMLEAPHKFVGCGKSYTINLKNKTTNMMLHILNGLQCGKYATCSFCDGEIGSDSGDKKRQTYTLQYNLSISIPCFICSLPSMLIPYIVCLSHCLQQFTYKHEFIWVEFSAA